MTNTTYKSFEQQIKAVALLVQTELKRIESIHRFELNCEVDGRLDGDLKISYRASVDYDSSVSGGHLDAVILEVMRRKGWLDKNAPTLISHVTGEVIDE